MAAPSGEAAFEKPELNPVIVEDRRWFGVMPTLMNACADGENLSRSNLAMVTTVENGE